MITAAAAVVAAAGVAVMISHSLRSSADDPANAKPQTSSTSSISSSTGSSPSGTVSSLPVKEAFSPEYSFSDWNQTCDWTMIVVNAYNPTPDDWDPDIIVNNTTSPQGVDQRILKSMNDMVNAAYADGVSLWVNSGYRSKESQSRLFEQEIQQNLQKGMDQSEAEEAAKKLVMPAGYSEHQTGLVIDINGVDPDFYQTKAYEWMSAHAAEYGFIERYPKNKESITGIDFEPWHYRYVGVENAKLISASGLCLEEYVYQQIVSHNQ